MVVSLGLGVAVGRWGTLIVEKERLVFERRVDLISRFLWKASQYTAEHVSGVVDQPDNVGKKKQELVRLSHQARLLVPRGLDEAIGQWVDNYTYALSLVADENVEVNQEQLAGELNEQLTALRDALKREISGSWLLVRWREWRDLEDGTNQVELDVLQGDE